MSGDDNGPSVAKAHDATADTTEEVLLSRLESLIFVYPEPITVRKLARVLSIKGKRVRELLAVIQEHYADRGIIVEEVAKGFQFRTHPANADVVRAATKAKPLRISRPALETLAIVAYRQPATRAEIEDVRRVDCGATLRFLFEKGLVRVLGRKEEPGRPIIYGTSAAFLELFGLKALDDLPSLREFTELWREHKDLVDDLEDDDLDDDPSDDTAEPTETAEAEQPGESEATTAKSTDSEDNPEHTTEDSAEDTADGTAADIADDPAVEPAEDSAEAPLEEPADPED
ncbi:MAG: SMC-Scp complex subunit ScpB [Deltaproteobacteria bacterium]|nr:SMC-Scp complex subunit ScpB [Deltaproteobacteria bacterium]